MTGLFCNFLLALIWVMLTSNFSGLNLLLGFGLGFVVIAVLQREVASLSGYTARLPRLVKFACFFVKELVKANMKVAFDVITPPLYMRPGVIALPLRARTHLEITLVANFISLTPGTLSLDISSDRRVLFIHAMFLQDEQALMADLREVERRILEIMR